MRVWLRQHRQALAAALRRLARAPGLLSALVIGVALSLPVGSYALLDGLRTVTARLAPEPQISLFLPLEAKRADADALAARLRADPRISEVRFVSRDQALKDLQKVEGIAEVVAAIGRNPLPDTLIVSAPPNRIEALAGELRKLPGIAQVQADAAWAQRLAALEGIGRLALALLAALLGIALVAVTFNTIRLQILTQRDEIEVCKLIGATDAFIRRPFYYFGLLQGLSGGAVALAIAGAAVALLNREVKPLAESYGSAFAFALPPAAEALLIVALAGALGWGGAQLSVSRHLRDIEPA
jgi:cell division transport system permease protein